MHVKLTSLSGYPALSLISGNGSHLYLEEYEGRKRLSLPCFDFLAAVSESVLLWYEVKLPAHYRTAEKIMSQVSFNWDWMEERNPKNVQIGIGSESLIRYREPGVDVIMPMERFVKEALKFFAQNQQISVGQNTIEFQQKFLSRWNTALKPKKLHVV